jgi:hypothetical protein
MDTPTALWTRTSFVATEAGIQAWAIIVCIRVRWKLLRELLVCRFGVNTSGWLVEFRSCKRKRQPLTINLVKPLAVLLRFREYLDPLENGLDH